jgi:3'(2'), 5'-bisphosphate nucleotidase
MSGDKAGLAAGPASDYERRMTAPLNRQALLEGLVAAAVQAGTAIWRIFQGEVEVRVKADESPVTAADEAAEAVILSALRELAPGIPVVAEEEAAAGRIPEVADRFFLVDPLDGTKEFIRRGADFTVNIALIEDGTPTLGVVYAPALSRLFAGDVAAGAWASDTPPEEPEKQQDRRPIRVRDVPASPVAVASKSHDVPATEAYLEALGVTERVSVGSSLKFCLLAAGEADLYPRPSPTSEWDTAAGHAVLAAAGGRVFAPEGGPLRYGKPGFLNPGFVATGPYEAPPIAPFMAE